MRRKPLLVQKSTVKFLTWTFYKFYLVYLTLSGSTHLRQHFGIILILHNSVKILDHVEKWISCLFREITDKNQFYFIKNIRGVHFGFYSTPTLISFDIIYSDVWSLWRPSFLICYSDPIEFFYPARLWMTLIKNFSSKKSKKFIW